MIEEEIVRHARFSGAAFYEAALESIVFVGGVGGIGSHLVPLLSRLVKEIYIYDDDFIDTSNLGGQNFTVDQLGLSKVFAVREYVKRYGTALLHPYREKVTSETDVPDVYVFACFDNMEARSLLFEKWAANPDRELYVEARLLMSQYEVYFVQKGQEDRYRKTLFSDDEVGEVACTLKQTSHFAAMCAGTMIWGFTNFLSQHMFHSLPFHVNVEGDLFLFETKD